MSSFDETQHPRGRTGQFAAKANSAPDGELCSDSDNDAVELRVSILPNPDPAGGFDTSVDAPTGKHYLREGVPHRLDGPAYVGHDGSEVWFQNGELHRDIADGPALVDEYDGGVIEEFYEHGQLVLP